MPDRPQGSIWTVRGVENGHAVVLFGPVAAAHGTPEYVVAPIYYETDPGFVWSDRDVRLMPDETGLPQLAFAAIWNARPALTTDLVDLVGQLPGHVTSLLPDAYWAMMQDRPVKNNRTGKTLRALGRAASQFRVREVQRWSLISGRALAGSRKCPPQSAGVLRDVQLNMLGFQVVMSARQTTTVHPGQADDTPAGTSPEMGIESQPMPATTGTHRAPGPMHPAVHHRLQKEFRAPARGTIVIPPDAAANADYALAA